MDTVFCTLWPLCYKGWRNYITAKNISPNSPSRLQSALGTPRWHRLAPSPVPSESHHHWSSGRRRGSGGRWRGPRPSRCRTSLISPSALSASHGNESRCYLDLHKAIAEDNSLGKRRAKISLKLPTTFNLIYSVSPIVLLFLLCRYYY